MSVCEGRTPSRRPASLALPLKTRRLEIRELEPGDLHAVHACTSDPLVARWFPWGPSTEQETREFIDSVVDAVPRKPRESYVLGVVFSEHGLIGVCFLERRGPREFEVGYYLRRDHWNRGFATEAVEALVAFAFRDLGASRVFARVEPANPASARILEGIGFRLEEHVPRDRLINGEWRDSLVYVRLAEPAAAP